MIEQINQASGLSAVLCDLKKSGLQIGFVPTMGALHEGHLSIIRQCKHENDICVASIFINRTQFNDKNDFDKYPRIVEADIKKLEEAGCDIVFTPDEEEIYPRNDFSKTIIDLGYTGTVLEAAHRPGHFDGVVTIVHKLFEIVQPHKAYFGQKDYQQCQVVKKMTEHFKSDIRLVFCETVREKDGLAMSSRNMLLNPDERNLAPIIYRTLSMAKKLLMEKSIAEVKDWAQNTLRRENLINFEYFEIVDADTLKPIISLNEAEHIIICTALKIGNTRLIDNIIVK